MTNKSSRSILRTFAAQLAKHADDPAADITTQVKQLRAVAGLVEAELRHEAVEVVMDKIERTTP